MKEIDLGEVRGRYLQDEIEWLTKKIFETQKGVEFWAEEIKKAHQSHTFFQDQLLYYHDWLIERKAELKQLKGENNG